MAPTSEWDLQQAREERLKCLHVLRRIHSAGADPGRTKYSRFLGLSIVGSGEHIVDLRQVDFGTQMGPESNQCRSANSR